MKEKFKEGDKVFVLEYRHDGEWVLLDDQYTYTVYQPAIKDKKKLLYVIHNPNTIGCFIITDQKNLFSTKEDALKEYGKRRKKFCEKIKMQEEWNQKLNEIYTD